ncbi:hypothetical protein PISL3812_05451 [Talaromyces islandicus]|uniref:Uncharacterized protein n=1 Tax=Talaromyces islandicus TaxID=28573 RepID=A0A0U1M0C8_TALIS|nr:hypothetical protein PISL3812_05451 [Talaromyces islandicus]
MSPTTRKEIANDFNKPQDENERDLDRWSKLIHSLLPDIESAKKSKVATFPIDDQEQKNIYDQVRAQEDQIRSMIQGGPDNFGSPPQTSKVTFSNLGGVPFTPMQAAISKVALRTL